MTVSLRMHGPWRSWTFLTDINSCYGNRHSRRRGPGIVRVVVATLTLRSIGNFASFRLATHDICVDHGFATSPNSRLLSCYLFVSRISAFTASHSPTTTTTSSTGSSTATTSTATTSSSTTASNTTTTAATSSSFRRRQSASGTRNKTTRREKDT